ncbi:hypothetical protein SKAU_G00027110 [Synaphobranchus kaupii]|uniref:Sodium-dependent multivitamin transporter n=1 Tax=Synaphobranchus kaupii TaxID=118154 RepID=A0A9Q1GE66_SYNKA|nr:hypothetical protein SKAU_G00027110 [Synaphobranchus kaupii]
MCLCLPLQAATSIFGIIGGPLLGLFTLGILFPSANSTGGLAGLLSGLILSLWVGIGARVYPPLPERSRPLGLTTAGCNFTLTGHGMNLTMGPTLLPLATTILPEDIINDTVYSRPFLADRWYSLSYLYFSPIGTLTVLAVGLIVSQLTALFLDSINNTIGQIYASLCSTSSKMDQIMKRASKLHLYKENVKRDFGTKNPAFSNVELDFTEHTEPRPSAPASRF